MRTRSPPGARGGRSRRRCSRARRRPSRADSRSPTAIAICTRAGSSFARASRLQVSSSSARTMIAVAASSRPWARRTSASPACGRPHNASASLNASSAPSRSPRRRRTSASSANPAAACARLTPTSSAHARVASCSASAHSPRHWSAHARCTRHSPGNTANGCRSDHFAVASVHSAARRESPSSSQALIKLQ